MRDASEQQQPSTVLTAHETASLLHRILDELQQGRRKRWVEITVAIVLSLAAVGSAWCAYQASRWGGVQTFALAEAGKADRRAMEHHLAALTFRSFDATMLISFIQARGAGDTRFEEFLHQRFRPEMKVALEAWLQTDPFNSPAAPHSPFQMPEYVQADTQTANAQAEQAAHQHALAAQANSHSDAYVLRTVLFATVLFFGGIAGTIQSLRIRRVLAAMALLLCAATLAFLATMPIVHG